MNGFTEYWRACQVLGVTPLADAHPAARSNQLPPWMSMPLLATEAAREKLSAWVARTPREEWETPAHAASTLVAASIVGDPVGAHCVARALHRLPRPVHDYAVSRCTFVVLGPSFAGWCGPRLDSGDRPWVIVLRATPDLTEFERLVWHEVGHAWLLEEPAPAARLESAFVWGTVHNTPESQIPAAAMAAVQRERRACALDERQVEDLLRAWSIRR